MTPPATHHRVAKADRTVGQMTYQTSAPVPEFAIDPHEVGANLLGERLLAAARIASVMHAQAEGLSGRLANGAIR